MLNLTFAAWGSSIQTWTFIDFAKLIVLVVAVCAVVYVGTQAMGWTIPSWLIRLAIIVAVAFCTLLAISLLASM